jgi:arylsulfatase
VSGEHCKLGSTEQKTQYATDGRRKFAWLPSLGVEQFFDLEQDPGECVDLIGDPGRWDEIAQWRGYLVRKLVACECGRVRGGPVWLGLEIGHSPQQD